MRQDVGVDGDAQRISQLCWMFFLKILDDQDQQLELMKPTATRSPMPDGAAVGSLGGGSRGDDRRRAARASSTTSCFPSLKELSARRAAGAPPARGARACSRTPTTT